MVHPTHDELYDKYRVFREPEDHRGHGHPVPVMAYIDDDESMVPPLNDDRLEELEDFYFVLRPTKDPHALKALKAYTKSLERQGQHLQLTSDLMHICDELDETWSERRHDAGE